MSVLNLLLADLPSAWQVERVHIGDNWILSIVESNGQQRAGLASTPPVLPVSGRFQIGVNQIGQNALQIAPLVLSTDQLETAVGMATLNALLQPDPQTLTSIDAADWLSQNSHEKSVAVVGRFPFIVDEIEPFARQVWTFEHDPQPGEFSVADMPKILPQADIVAITSSTIINHTLDAILALIPKTSRVMLLGPTTPLTPQLFSLGIDLLSGIQVVNIDQCVDSVASGVSFRQMQGLRRVTLCSSRLVC